MRKYLLSCGKLTMMLALLFLFANGTFADIVISSGTTMKVSSGSSVVLAGDFTNNGSADLGDGSFVFNGTATQNIDGSTTSEFGNIELDNAAGLNLAADAQVDGTLTLTSGVFDIDDQALTFGASANAVSGTFSASRMILADDPNAEVRRAFNDGTSHPDSFFFPIGSNDGTAEYSPVEIDFNNSTFSSAYVGVNVTPLTEPNNTSIDSYLERYWTIKNVGITAYTYNLTATYVDNDIVGIEADISGALYTGTSWMIGDPVNTGNNTFLLNDFDDDGNGTGVEFRILANIGVVCQGAWDDVNDEMNDGLNSILPLDAATAYAEYGYTGTESVAAIPSTDIVDWILVEVRDATSAANATSATSVETVAGFLLKDGSIVGLDGVNPLKMKALISNNAYFVIHQRNHLAVMTASSPAESFGNYTYDFKSSMASAYGTNPMVQVDASPVTFAMYAGETNNSGTVTNADKTAIDANMNVSAYLIGDINFTGTVSNGDKQDIDNNMNISTEVPN